MECSKPGTIRDQDFIAYLEGEFVQSAIVQHFAQCQHCSSLLMAYRNIELKLASRLYRQDCPSNQILGEYQMGLLDDQQASEIRSHLSLCLLCVAEVATLTKFLANDPMFIEIARLSSSSLNHHVSVQGTTNILDHSRSQSRAHVQRIQASLLPDRHNFVLRNDLSSQDAQWPRCYTAGDVDISLHVERKISRKELFQLVGFVARKDTRPETLEGTLVQLSSPTNEIATQSIDELGNFLFSSLAPTTYLLELCFPENIIVIDQLRVGMQD